VNRNLRNRVALGLVLTAVLLLTVGIFVMRGTRQFVASSKWVEHTHDVLTALEHVYATVKDVEADQRGYLLTGRVELEQEGERLAGKTVGSRLGRPTPISNGSITNNEVYFEIERTFGEIKSVTKYRGKQSGDTITGTMESEVEGEDRVIDWEATRED